jgi:hypothetical protein
MKEFEFTLCFNVTRCHLSMDEIDDRLFEAGCDDALVRHSKNGAISLEFIRAAHSAQEAMLSAVEDVVSALPDAVMVEVKPDYVSPTDIAGYLNVSRQYILKVLNSRVMLSPVTTVGNTQVFHLINVLEAFKQARIVTGDKLASNLSEAALAAKKLNLNRELEKGV